MKGTIGTRLIWARRDDYCWRAGPYWVAKWGRGVEANYSANYVPVSRGSSPETSAEYFRTRELLGFRETHGAARALCERHAIRLRQEAATAEHRERMGAARAALHGAEPDR